MNRRTFMQLTAATFAPAQTARPNVLFIVVDDLDCRIGCYGDGIAKTPNLDRLAARGVRFNRAYCQYPLCNPTRSSVLSGRYPTSSGVLDNNTFLLLGAGHATLPAYFERHGYAVGTFGKIWHGINRGFASGEAKGPPEWFTPDQRAAQQAAEPDYWNRVHSPYRNISPPDPAAYSWANVFGPLPEGDEGVDTGIALQAEKELDKMAASGKPFFLAVGFNKPHVPLQAPKKFFDLYKTSEMPLPPDFDTEPRQLPGMPRDEFRQNIDLFAGRSFSALEAREAMRAYYSFISCADALVGRTLDRLR